MVTAKYAKLMLDYYILFFNLSQWENVHFPIRTMMRHKFLSGLYQNQSSEPQMSDSMRADGKIWIVICVIAIIFISLAAFMLYIERKVKKIEDQLNNK